MKTIIMIPSGSLSGKEIRKIEETGRIVIVIDEPEKIKMIYPVENSDNTIMLKAALEVLESEGWDAGQNFVKLLNKYRNEANNQVNEKQ